MMKINVVLLPLALLYDLATRIRNYLYLHNVLKVFHPPVKTIAIGNLSMGGSGKTPVAEYLIRLLSEEFGNIAYLSRGYKRKSKGFVIAGDEINYRNIGDEAFQVYRKFPNATIMVSNNRKEAIEYFSEKTENQGFIILDDALQHRQVRCGLNILLTSYHRPYFQDFIFPAGSLRESKKYASLPDIILITKCPPSLSQKQQDDFLSKIRPLPHQSVFFTFLRYQPLYPAFSHENIDLQSLRNFHIITFTGIADTRPLEEYLNSVCKKVIPVKFQDHKEFCKKNIQRVAETFEHCQAEKKIIVTTEKDFSRIKGLETEKYLENLPLFILPVETAFYGNTGNLFKQKILDYVGKN